MGDFKVGDRVRIKSWDRMTEEYTEEKYGNGIQLPVSRFDISMKPLCGLTATIKNIDGDHIKLKNWSDGNEHTWTFSIYMIEKVYTVTDIKWFESPTTLSFEFKIDDKDWEEICSKLDDIEHCDFCKYHNDCHGVLCYGGEPIEPPCAYQTVGEYVDNKKFYEMYIKGIWKNEEENEMKNEVLELWFKRKGNDIEKKYDSLESKYIDEKYSVVKSYEDMIKDFERQLEELYSYSNTSEQFALVEINDCNDFKYAIDEDKLVEEAKQFYREDKKKEMDNVLKEYSEIDALLSMSEDLEYQQSILIEYGIIDKKTKRMINEDNTK